MKRIALILLLVLLAAMAFIGPDSLAGLVKSSHTAAPETDTLPDLKQYDVILTGYPI